LALPGNINTITVTGSFANALGISASGTVLFTPSSVLTDTNGMVILTETPIIASLAAGVFSVVLPCTDNTSIRPSPFYYTVTLGIAGSGQQSFNISLPSTLGSTVDMSALVPVPSMAMPSPGLYVISVNGQSGSVEVLGGATVSGAPSAGQVLTATSAAAAGWAAAPVDWINVVTQFGADPTGMNYSTTPIQNALNYAATGTGGSGISPVVYFPAGKYTYGALNINTIGSGHIIRLIGDGQNNNGTWLIGTSNSSNITFSNTGTVEITGIQFENQGTGHILDSPAPGWYHDLSLNLDAVNTGGSCIAVYGSSTLINSTFERIGLAINTAGRTAPMISLASSGSGNLSNNTFAKLFFNNTSGADNAQYAFYIACTGAAGSHYATVLRDLYFEKPFGGAIQSLSGENLTIENCQFWDLFGDNTVASSLIDIDTYAGAQIAQGTRITNCGRNLTPAGISATGAYDIQLGTASGTHIEGYYCKNTASTENDVYFSLNSQPGVTLINNQSPVIGGSGTGNEGSKTCLISPNLTSTTVMQQGTVWPGPKNALQPAGCIASSCDRDLVTTSIASPGSGVGAVRAIWLPAGLTLSNLTFQTNSVVKTAGTHGWYVLANTARLVLAATADQTDAATVWGTTSTAYPLAFTAPFVTTYTGWYWMGQMVAVSAGSVPTFSGQGSLVGGLGGTDGQCGTFGTGLTTPPVLGSTLAAITGTGTNLYYAYLS
jgi:hypothetical protein